MVLARLLTVHDLRPLDAVMRRDIRMTFDRLCIPFIRYLSMESIEKRKPYPEPAHGIPR